jgi:predicted nucleic acid-binding protein
MEVSKIFWDTNLFIYLFERNPEFSDKTIALRVRMKERDDELLTSSLTLGEVQVLPLKIGEIDTARRYRQAILQTSKVIPFGDEAADFYAQIREKTTVRGPDAIQLACAAAEGVEVFITNDTHLHRLHIPRIHFITSIDRAPLY